MKTTKLTTKVETPKKGRPFLALSLPQNAPFTVPFIFNREQRLGKKITKVTVANHIKREVNRGTIKIVNKKIVGPGRPTFVYQNAAAKGKKVVA